ncbi:hypothetical protein [Winogradskyella ursingii]|uniref:hypothetical protein n=1 Tax=Winogradskyella ursingii TaxID=2686079 RepID=UPI0015CCD1C0|nr:hypothetical protein [Winogradskyella ursingii]
MNRITLILLLLLFTSCNYFEKKKVYSDELLEEELQTFNWNEVDTYPTFSNCDSLTTKIDTKTCFQNTLLSHVNTYLGLQNIAVSKDVNDTIKLKLIINKQGVLEVDSINVKQETTSEIPKIDSLLRESFNDIPKIYPAIKRGQQVTTVFVLPVIVKID